MQSNSQLIHLFHEAQQQGDAATVLGLLADDVVWHVPGRNLLSRNYVGKAEVAKFFAPARELSNGSVRTELVDVLGGDKFAVALVRVYAERQGRSLGHGGAEELVTEAGLLVGGHDAMPALPDAPRDGS